MALSRRRIEHLEALVALTTVSMAEAQAKIADQLVERDELTEEELQADNRIFLREMAAEFKRRGDQRSLGEVLVQLGDDTPEQQRADEAGFEAFAQRNGWDAERLRAARESRARRVRSHLQWVEVVNTVLARMPRAEAARVTADLMDGGTRSPLTERVKQATQQWAARLEREASTS